MSDYLVPSPAGPGARLARWCARHWAALSLALVGRGVAGTALAVAAVKHRDALGARAAWEAAEE